jgi:hypothetical protein
MSYDEHDASLDSMYEQLGRELYQEHIEEFTAEMLRSYYVANPTVMLPARDALEEGVRLKEGGHHAAALVFFATTVELLLKGTLLIPVVHGLVHSNGVANVIAEKLIQGEKAFDNYSGLLKKLFIKLTGIDIGIIARPNRKENLLAECKTQQTLRNQIVHQGFKGTVEQATLGNELAVAVHELLVCPLLASLGLTVNEKGEVQLRRRF